jgi:hypothetical protein
MNPNYIPPTPNPVAYGSAPVAQAQPLPSQQVGPMSGFNDGGAREFLSTQGWPAGLQDTFVKHLSKIAFRFFICDDSGSMSSGDGKKLVVDGNKNKRYNF